MVISNNNNVIIELVGVNFRIIQKVQIYINSQNYSFLKSQDSITVYFEDSNNQYKFLLFLINMDCFQFDNQSQDIISLKKQEENNDIEKKQELIDIKESDVYTSVPFKEYCYKCDMNLCITLRDYQYKSSYLLYKSRNGFDFSVPGAGKTIISYATYSNFITDKLVDSLFIIGPKNSYNAWYDEYFTCFEKEPNFENLSFKSIEDARIYLNTSINNHKEITFINYEKLQLLVSDIKKFISNHKCLLIVDEAHKVKNPRARQTIALMDISKLSTCIIELTGTPMPNGYEDLYSECEICFPNKSILPYNFGELKALTKNPDENKERKIMEAIYPYFSRVSKKYLLKTGELLEPEYNTIYVEMDHYQREIYNLIGKISDDIKNDWESAFAIALKKAMLIRQMQASANPSLLNRAIFSSIEDFKNMIIGEIEENITSEEFEKIKQKIEDADNRIMKDVNNSDFANLIIKYKNENISNKNITAIDLCKKIVDSGKKVLLWDVFVDNMFELEAILLRKYNIKAGVINGFISNQDRQSIIKRFKEENLMVLIASPATLAESISLHKACQTAIYVNRNFNAAQFIQSKDRIHRINMPLGTTATYYFLENIDSVDVKIDERLLLKENRMLRILDSDDIIYGDLETSENCSLTIEDMKSIFN